VADNVAITAGSGTSIATDDVSGVHYQKIKIAMGGSDAATLLQKATLGAVSNSTTDTTVASSSAILYGVTCFSTNSTGAVRAYVMDSTSGSTGTRICGFFLSTGAGAVRSQGYSWFPQGLDLNSGIRVVIPTTSPATVSVYYTSPA
jgi:hypothetical protein